MSLDYDALLVDPSPLLALWEKHHLTPRRDHFFTAAREACLLGALAVDAGCSLLIRGGVSSGLDAALGEALGLPYGERADIIEGFDTGLTTIFSTPARLLGALVANRLGLHAQ